MEIIDGYLTSVDEGDIKDGVFKIPEGVIGIRSSAFDLLFNLKKIEFSSTVRFIEPYSFYRCFDLEEVELCNGIKTIDPRAFAGSYITKINIPVGVEKICVNAFDGCRNLKQVIVSDSVYEIEEAAFANCESLEYVKLPKDLKAIKTSLFYNDKNLKMVDLPNNIKIIVFNAFEKCGNLSLIDLPENLEIICKDAFASCKSLETIKFPKSTKYIAEKAFLNCQNLKEVTLHSSFTDTKTDTFEMCENIGVLNVVLSNGKIKTIKKQHAEKYFDNKVFDWIEKHKNQYVPNIDVIQTLNLNESELFYSNFNDRRWEDIVKNFGLGELDDKTALFKLCYVLGLFSQKTSESENAFNFIKQNICRDFNNDQIVEKFSKLDISNGFKKDFADMFMMYYNKGQDGFSYILDGYGKIDLICDVYNRFDDIKKFHTYSSVKTNTRRRQLTPKMCLDFVVVPKYEVNGVSIIEHGCEKLAKMAGIYGYNTREFKRLQRWYLKAKESHGFLKLAEPEDSSNKDLLYYANLKMTEEAVFLGNISQCCQTVSDSGEACLKYGLESENSTFMKIESKDKKFYAQAWVWYNEETKTICLDNLEMPGDIMNELIDYTSNEKIFNEFFGALARYARDIATATIKKGYPVDKVTLGMGHNDLMSVLNIATNDISSKVTLREDSDFGDEMSQPPQDYGLGYSDAIYGQYVLWRKDGFIFYNDKTYKNGIEK